MIQLFRTPRIEPRAAECWSCCQCLDESADVKPEEQRQDGRGADVDAAAGDGREDAAGEARHDQDEAFPRAEVLDRVVGDSLVLPGKDKRNVGFLFN